VAPLWLGGLRGKQSTPSDWLGGTGVVSTVGEGSGMEQEWYESARSSFEAGVKATICFSFCMIEGIRTLALSYCYQHFCIGIVR
jgi:hypothetical protein